MTSSGGENKQRSLVEWSTQASLAGWQVGRWADIWPPRKPRSEGSQRYKGARHPGGWPARRESQAPSYRPVAFSESHRRFPVHVPISKALRRSPRLPRLPLEDPAPNPRRQPPLSHTLALIQVPKQPLDRPSQHRLRANASGWLRKNLTGSADAAEAVAIMPRHHLGDARQRRHI